MRVIRKEVRQRGFFGYLFLVLFWTFNALMAFVLFRMAEAGTVIGTGLVIMVWGFGAVILGMMCLLTRGRSIITEETID